MSNMLWDVKVLIAEVMIAYKEIHLEKTPN
jgi:hypothetical protein